MRLSLQLTRSRAALVLGGLLLSACGPGTAPPKTWPNALKHRAWQFQFRDLEWIKARTDDAAALNINAIQLSHDVMMDVTELEDPARLELVRAATLHAKAKGLATYAWVHEFEGIPPQLLKSGRVDFDNPELWTMLDARYKRLFEEQVPDLAGMVLTFHESTHIVYEDGDVASALDPSARTARLISRLQAICAKYGRTLMVRDFSYEPAQVVFIQRALREVSQTVGPHDLIVMSKEVPHDWHPFYPNNPTLGDCGGFDQILENDSGSEFYGQSVVPYDQVAYQAMRLRFARDKGAIGGVTRLERFSKVAWGTPSEVSIFGFSRLLSEPDSDVGAIRLEWVQQRYGATPAAPLVASALARTFDVVNATLFPQREWVSDHSQIPTIEYVQRHLEDNARAKWTGAGEDAMNQQRLLHPTLETIGAVDAEKDRAVAEVELSLAELEGAKPSLSKAHSDELKRQFELLRDVTLTFKLHNRAVFSYFRFRDTGLGRDELVALDDQLTAKADFLEATYGTKNYSAANKSASSLLRAFARDLSRRLQ